jgi:hypothetical protein
MSGLARENSDLYACEREVVTPDTSEPALEKYLLQKRDRV